MTGWPEGLNRVWLLIGDTDLRPNLCLSFQFEPLALWSNHSDHRASGSNPRRCRSRTDLHHADLPARQSCSRHISQTAAGYNSKIFCLKRIIFLVLFVLFIGVTLQNVFIETVEAWSCGFSFENLVWGFILRIYFKPYFQYLSQNQCFQNRSTSVLPDRYKHSTGAILFFWGSYIGIAQRAAAAIIMLIAASGRVFSPRLSLCNWKVCWTFHLIIFFIFPIISCPLMKNK